MIHFKTPLGELALPSNFHEITVEDFDFVKANSEKPFKVLEHLTGMGADKLLQLNLDPVVEHLKYLNIDLFKSFEASQSILIGSQLYDLPEDIKRMEWGQKLLASQAYLKGDFVKIVATYLQPIVDNSIWHGSKFNNERVENIERLLKSQSIDAVYSCVVYLTNQLNEIAIKEKALNSNTTPEQVQAGIANFNALGDFNTIDLIAKGKPWKYKQVLAMDYNTIFGKLYHIKISANFERRLSEILNKKK